MAKHTVPAVTTWTCDRCLSTVDKGAFSATINFHTKDSVIPTKKGDVKDLCEECRFQLAQWWVS